MTIFRTATVRSAFGRAVLYDLDHPMKMHAHSGGHALVHLGGEPATYTFEMDGAVHVSHERDVTFIDPWVPHADLREGLRRSTVLALYFEPGMILGTDGRLVATSFGARTQTIGAELHEGCRQLCAKMVARQTADGDRRDEATALPSETETAFDEVAAGFLARHATSHRFAAFSPGVIVDRHVRAALRYMNEHKHDAFFAEALTTVTGLSRSFLFERFHEVTGMTPKRYADAVRSEEAIRLLATSDFEVRKIARALSFSSPGNFTRFMRGMTALSPMEHRRNARANGCRPLDLPGFDEIY